MKPAPDGGVIVVAAKSSHVLVCKLEEINILANPGRGVTVNAIAPGFIETDMTSELKPELREGVLKQIPMGTFGQADDIAGGALYLASAAGRYVTGQVLTIDGGMVM